MLSLYYQTARAVFISTDSFAHFLSESTKHNSGLLILFPTETNSLAFSLLPAGYCSCLLLPTSNLLTHSLTPLPKEAKLRSQPPLTDSPNSGQYTNYTNLSIQCLTSVGLTVTMICQ